MSDYAARFGPLALLYASDQPKAIAQYARNALAEGRIDAVVCNDYFPAIRAPVSEAKLEDLRAGFDALVVAPFALVKELVPHLKTQASPSRIVVVSSASALRGLANYSMYCVARGAQNAMVLALAKECVVLCIPFSYSRAPPPRPGWRRLTLASMQCSFCRLPHGAFRNNTHFGPTKGTQLHQGRFFAAALPLADGIDRASFSLTDACILSRLCNQRRGSHEENARQRASEAPGVR